MELPQVGKNCYEIGCNKLDFLPLVCKCNKQFCSEHFTVHVQHCEVTLRPNDTELRKIENTHTCSHPECSETSILPLVCEKCKKHFCVKHRHIISCGNEDLAVLEAAKEKYAAQMKFSSETKAMVDKQIENKLADAKRKEKNRKTANKVELMRLKCKSTGLKSIPVADRVYFSIQVSKEESQCSVVPIFVSRTWSLGRTIDAVANECKLQNNNNKPNMKSLRLFKRHNGKSVSKNLSVTLSSLIENDVITDGENLIIKYVNVDCEQI